MILLAGLGLFLLFLFVPALNFPGVKQPVLNSFVKDNVEVIPLAPVYRTKLQEVHLLDSASNENGVIDYELMPYEELIHASDFENEMAPFYNQLQQLSSRDTVLRILHFGDSQIEGDRISGVLRNNMQAVFGGCGIGFIPVSESRVHRLNVNKQVAGWKRFKVFGEKQKASHQAYGFTGYVHQTDAGMGTIHLNKKDNYFNKTQSFERFSLLYKSTDSSAKCLFGLSGDTMNSYSLIPSGKVQLKTTSVNGYGSKGIDVQLSTTDSSTFIYGIALDCKKGIAVDNVAMRGSSGIEFTKIDRSNLKQQMDLMNTGLVIYQFGVNVIPFVLQDYTFYENMVYQQLHYLKQLMPNASFLVIGVSDMARKEGGQYFSYPNIEKVKTAQQNAAKRAGCAFWDLHKVMGGENAIKEWVVASPPLAEKDYTHFNFQGAKLIGNQLFKAIMQDYQVYLKGRFN